MDNSGTGGTVGQASNRPGHAFFVSMADLLLCNSANEIVLDDTTRDYLIAATFMHELGHTLGLRHGGCDDINNKPNYFSIMNYMFPIGIPAPTATPPFRVDYSDSAVVHDDWNNLVFNWGVEGSSQIAMDIEMPGWSAIGDMPDEITIEEALASAVEAQELAKKQHLGTLSITNAPTKPLQYKSSVTLTASEPVTWSSNSSAVKVNPATGKVESISVFGFTKSGTTVITATSLDGQRTASVTIQIKPVWWQWIIIIVLFGWLWF